MDLLGSRQKVDSKQRNRSPPTCSPHKEKYQIRFACYSLVELSTAILFFVSFDYGSRSFPIKIRDICFKKSTNIPFMKKSSTKDGVSGCSKGSLGQETMLILDLILSIDALILFCILSASSTFPQKKLLRTVSTSALSSPNVFPIPPTSLNNAAAELLRLLITTLIWIASLKSRSLLAMAI